MKTIISTIKYYFLRLGVLLSRSGNRKDLLIRELQSLPSVLEIGPYFRPHLKGQNIFYFDILDKKSLVLKCLEEQEDEQLVLGIPEIDFVSKSGDLSKIERTFSAVFSSHVVEHQIDLITHLRQVSSLLDDDGFYCLYVPDKRYCFDHYVPESSLANILAEYYNQFNEVKLNNVLNHFAFKTHNNPHRHWKGDHGERVLSKLKMQTALKNYKEKKYSDIHIWYFTSYSFLQIIKTLHYLGLIDFVVDEFIATQLNEFEFYIKLKKVKQSDFDKSL